ncbi:MAG: hypothetical protein A2020_00775 [Lentisphaerae bacterium GWF2_45_14]|nr:MAG: hypothetical protein A2020_00775 [Lentisphaerae bacterium GWF2_45_14]
MRKSFFLVLASAALASCTLFNTKPELDIPPVKIDNSIGDKMIERPLSSEVFNGNFDLGKAGWALTYYIRGEHALDDNIPQLSTVKMPDSETYCLKVPSIPGADNYWLAGREVYLKKGAEIELSYNAKIKKVPGSSDIKTFFLDFRNFNEYRHGMSTKERYWLNALSIKVSEKWQPARKNLTIPRDDYYFFCFAIQAKDDHKPLPEIYIDSVKLTPLNEIAKSSLTYPQIAIYESKPIPAYRPDEEVSYEIKAEFPKISASLKELYLDIVDDQTLEPVFTTKMDLKRNNNGLYTGKCSFKVNRYGSYSTRVRDSENSELDWFGGDFVVTHPPMNYDAKSLSMKVGMNSVNHRIFPGNEQFHNYVTADTLKNYYNCLKIAGINHVRSWNFKWKTIEPEKGKFNFTETDRIVKEYNKRNIELIGVLGLYFGKDKAPRDKQNIPDWLLPLCKMHPVSKSHPEEAFVPPFDLWENYCKTLMEHYKNDIKIWEVFNEPNGWMTPENYLEYLKAARRAADAVGSGVKIIGPCPTGDFAVDRFAGWSKEFLALGGEKYIDGFAFHPYGASNDFQHGEFFEATATLNAIRSWLKNKSLPMYNTECYHFPNTLRLRTICADASTILRHYLIQVGNGVCTSSLADSQIYKSRLNAHVRLNMYHIMESIPGPAAAALNNLSFQLKDYTQSEVLKIQKFINCYLFSGAEDGSAVAALWDLRPNGSHWTSIENSDGLIFFDMWGNQFSAIKDGVNLGLNPVYVKGKKGEILSFLDKSKFKLGSPLKIFGRKFKNDLYLDAVNLTEMRFSPEVKFTEVKGLKLPEAVQFAFTNNRDSSLYLPGTIVPGSSEQAALFTVFAQSENSGGGRINFLPETQAYDLPFSGAKPLEITLPEGSKASMTAEKDYLSITVSVKDKNIASPKKYAPWSGDAVEIFIDPAPFASLDRNLLKGGEVKLPMSQYICPAKPLPEDKNFWTNSQSTFSPEVKTEETDDGYKTQIKIPWKAITGSENAYRIYGIDIEVDHVKEQGKKLSKETLSGKKGESYQKRLHYPLFRIPEQANLDSCPDALNTEALINGSFEKKKLNKNEPEGWMERWDRTEKVFKYGNNGWNGSRGVIVKLDEPSPIHVQGWPQQFKCNPDGKTQLFIQGFVKAENIKIAGKDEKSSGLRFFCHFYNDIKKKHMDNIGIGVNESITGSFGWKKMQFAVPVPYGATSCQLSCGLSKGVTGTVYFDDITVKVEKLNIRL